MSFVSPLALTIALVFGLGAPAAAQNLTNADIQRLQDSIYDASRDVAQVRGRDAALATQLQTELDDLRDETVYLKVKLRRNEPIGRNEYSDVRDRIENIRSRARNESGTRSVAPAGRTTDQRDEPATSHGQETRSNASFDVPVGTEFDVRLH